MADVKFTGLPAGVGIPNNGSLVAISTFDGAATYVSSKYTMTQLKDIVYVMEAEDKIVFDSSGTNKVFAQDSVGTAKIYFNADGANDVSLGTGIPYDTTPFLSISADDAAIGTGDMDGDIGMYFDSYGVQDRVLMYLRNGVNDAVYFEMLDNRVGNKTSINTSDSFGIIVGGRNGTFNSGVTNSPILGGVGIIANKDDYAFAQNLEVQGGTLNMTAESKITFDSTGTNKTFVDNGTAEITFDGGLLAIKADSGYAGGWVEVDSSIASLSFGTSKGDVAVTNVDASLKFGATNGVQANATGLGFFNATPVAQPTGVAVSAAGIHAALVSLGLITA